MPAVLRRGRRVERRRRLKPTLLQYAAVWAPLSPLAGIVISGRSPSRGQQWVLGWCALTGSLELLAMLLGALGFNNLWTGYAGPPLQSGLLLWLLAQWHPRKSAQLALKVAIPLVILVSAILTVTLDDPKDFSLAVAPFHSMVMLLASVWTFVALSLEEKSSIPRTDWFWIIGGIMLYAATAAAMQPLAWYLIRERVDLLHAAFNVRAAVVILSFAAITWGMLLRRTPRYSGGSSSPPSSPSSFSSAGSA